MKNGLKRDAFTVKNGGIFNTPILISKAEIRKSLVPSRFQSIEKEPQLQYISYHNYGSYLAEKEGFEPSRPFAEPTPLAGEPLTATWVLLQLNILLKNWRRERDSNPRCLAASLVFKTSSINHSDISPRSQRYDYNRTSAACQQQKRQKWIYIIFLSLPCSSPSCSPAPTCIDAAEKAASDD